MKRLIFPVLLLLVTQTMYSQADSLDLILNQIIWNDRDLGYFTDPTSSSFFLYGGCSGDSKTTYAGREIGQDMLTVNGSVYIFHSKGFFAGVSGIWYHQPENLFSATIASAGIIAPVNTRKTLNVRLSYSKSFYTGTDTIRYSYANNLGAGLSFTGKYLGARISTNVLFGEEFGFNVTPTIYSKIPLVKFGKSGEIQLEPDISALIGSEIIELESSGLGGQQGSFSESTTHEIYTLLNTQFYIPVCIYFRNLDIELGYSLNVPNRAKKDYLYSTTTFFSFSLGYMISFK